MHNVLHVVCGESGQTLYRLTINPLREHRFGNASRSGALAFSQPFQSAFLFSLFQALADSFSENRIAKPFCNR